MTEYLPRSAWTRYPLPEKLTQLDPKELKGVAVHYTGSKSPLGQTATLSQSSARLQAERSDHVNGRKWTDIAYQYAIDQAGRVFELRGLLARSAANGDVQRNKTYGAVTFLVGVGDTPTPDALQAFRDWRTKVWLPKYPLATKIVGHRDLYNTACPGDALYGLLSHLAQGPTQSPQAVEKRRPVDDPGLVKAITDELFSDAPDGAYYKVRRPDGSLVSVPVALSEIYRAVALIQEKLGV